MTPFPTVSALLEAMTVTNRHVDSAIEAYFVDADASAHQIADGYTLAVDAAVKGSPWVNEVVSDGGVDLGLKRGVVRTAILTAHGLTLDRTLAHRHPHRRSNPRRTACPALAHRLRELVPLPRTTVRRCLGRQCARLDRWTDRAQHSAPHEVATPIRLFGRDDLGHDRVTLEGHWFERSPPAQRGRDIAAPASNL